MPTSTIDSQLRLTIPKTVREHLGLRPGDQVDFIVTNTGEVTIRPVNEDFRKLKGLLYRPGRPAVSVQQMNDAIRRRATEP